MELKRIEYEIAKGRLESFDYQEASKTIIINKIIKIKYGKNYPAN